MHDPSPKQGMRTIEVSTRSFDRSGIGVRSTVRGVRRASLRVRCQK